MGEYNRLKLSRFFNVGEAATPGGCALLEERYRALQRQVPLLLVIILANVLGLHLATAARMDPVKNPGTLLIVCVVARLVHWTRNRSRVPAPAKILSELRRTLFMSGFFSFFFCCWAFLLFAQGNLNQQNYVTLFASLAAIGSAYALSSFPSAGRLPLILLALPVGARLLFSPLPAQIGVGISLILITLLTMRLLNLHNHAFSQLVRSRSEIASERERARNAERIANEEKARVRKVADTDPLTDLANRRAFLAALKEAAAETSGSSIMVALVDLDGFKPINDTSGHATGDAVLVEVSRRLRRAAGPKAVVARMGGDEFALLLRCRGEAGALKIGERISAALRAPYRVEGREVRISGCCGITVHRPGCRELANALSRGDAALYSAKQTGRGCVAMFSNEMEQVGRRRVTLERALRDPDIHESIELAFQPIIELDTMQLRSFEALARWTHPELGQIPPAEFISLAEQINVVEQIGEKMLGKAAEQAALWPEAIKLSFNLSAVQLCSVASARRVLRTMEQHGLDPVRLQIEVTETSLLVDFEAARRNLAVLRAAGARIVLDDFGAGFASISYLREINFDAIKLDGSLVNAAAETEASLRLLRGVLELCASLGVPCIAEHVEDERQIELLRRLKCRYGQGYALSEPLVGEAAAALARGRLLRFPTPLAPLGRSNTAA